MYTEIIFVYTIENFINSTFYGASEELNIGRLYRSWYSTKTSPILIKRITMSPNVQCFIKTNKLAQRNIS